MNFFLLPKNIVFELKPLCKANVEQCRFFFFTFQTVRRKGETAKVEAILPKEECSKSLVFPLVQQC